MSADGGSLPSRARDQNPYPDQRQLSQRRAASSEPPSPNPDDMAEQPHLGVLQRIVDALSNWDDLADRPWNLALLISLGDGPITGVAACAAALAWAEGQLPAANLPATLAELVGAGLAVHLGGRGDAGLFALSTAGAQLLDRFALATTELTLFNQLADFADTCVLHGRLLQLSTTEDRVLRLVVRGRTDQQIATELFSSRRAVEAQIQHILATLGISSRNALIARLTIGPTEF
jgi:DNA-binding CsgD family transcriptional regulator